MSGPVTRDILRVEERMRELADEGGAMGPQAMRLLADTFGQWADMVSALEHQPVPAHFRGDNQRIRPVRRHLGVVEA
jgi:hypothetical protein